MGEVLVSTKRKKTYVACVACGRLIVTLKNGHPRRHYPYDGLTPRVTQQNNRGPCDGMNYPGEKA